MQQPSEKDPKEILRSIPAWIRRHWRFIPIALCLCWWGAYELVTQECFDHHDCSSATVDGVYFLGLGGFLLLFSFLGVHWARIEALRNALTDDERIARHRVREALQFLADVLLEFNEPAAKHVLGSVDRHPQQIADNNALWGESGSLLEWIHRSNRGPSRIELEAACL